MTTEQIRFDDGAAYEKFMGVWSRLVGETFLDWLAPKPALRWLDVGCGNGAFTEMLAQRCAPKSLDGIDPSEPQLDYARKLPALKTATFRQGDAMALPYDNASFDVAVMPLVIFFVPTPAKGVAEMARVVAPGGWVTAYAWDMIGGGFPYADLRLALLEFGITAPMPPSPDASRLETMQTLWADAGLKTIETKAITVQRTFASFDEYWAIILGGPSAGPKLATMKPDEQIRFKESLRKRMPTDAQGRITYSARANAVKGQVPA